MAEPTESRWPTTRMTVREETVREETVRKLRQQECQEATTTQQECSVPSFDNRSDSVEIDTKVSY